LFNSLPNFLIIGSEKAGTTSIASTLNRQNSIFIPKIKEIHYFSHHWEKGLDWYKKYFPKNNNLILGEASPSYSDYPLINKVPKRIYETIPHVRLLYVVRNPIDRLISQYRHCLYRNWIPKHFTLEEAIENSPQLIDSGKYYFQIQQYLKYFSNKQIKVLCIEDMLKDPEYFGSVYEFIGLKNPNKGKFVVNNETDQKVIVPKYLEFARKNNILRTMLGTYHREGLLINRYYNVMKLFSRKKIPHPVISNKFKEKLINMYLPDIKMLSEYQKTDYIKKWRFDNK